MSTGPFTTYSFTLIDEEKNMSDKHLNYRQFKAAGLRDLKKESDGTVWLKEKQFNPSSGEKEQLSYSDVSPASLAEARKGLERVKGSVEGEIADIDALISDIDSL
jgi:hypothetical protein